MKDLLVNSRSIEKIVVDGPVNYYFRIEKWERTVGLTQFFSLQGGRPRLDFHS